VKRPSRAKNTLSYYSRKVTGIAILAELACNICKDCGETAIASKIDLGSKVLIMGATLPIISSLLEVILKILP
jgi:stage III sporulation protein AD